MLGPIIKRLGLHKGTVYNSVRRLEEKGFISYKNVDGIKSYVVNQMALKRLLRSKEEGLENSIQIIKNLIKLAERN